MLPPRLFLVLLCLIPFNAIAQRETARMHNRRVLVQMERDFANAAATKGMRDAFIEFLSDDGIIFQPGPVNGKKFWTERKPGKGLLSWQPAFADVSRGGDLGYTTGPWEFRPIGPQDNPVAFGQYFTIWKKQNDGRWKAVLDRGVSSGKPFGARVVQFPLNDEESDNSSKFNVASGRTRLAKLELEFSEASARKGTLKAYESYLADDARLLRKDVAPAIGKSAALVQVSASAGKLTWKPIATDVSMSGDLGYTYGTFELKNGDTVIEQGSYVRVWKKQALGWRVVVDVLSPDPTS
jgi:ketosteroid isomerase-like protein